MSTPPTPPPTPPAPFDPTAAAPPPGRARVRVLRQGDYHELRDERETLPDPATPVHGQREAGR